MPDLGAGRAPHFLPMLVLDEACRGHPCPRSELAFDDSNCARTQHNAAGSRAGSGACTAFPSFGFILQNRQDGRSVQDH
jgi:hypothetical protein